MSEIDPAIAAVLDGSQRWTVVCGDNRVALAGMPDASVDAVVCDPPYLLGFMGRAWDDPKDNIAASAEFWREVLRVAKPGAHVLAFGGTRTYHRMACAIEDAGWEIRDCLQWLYGSGFPKSLDIAKAIDKAAGHWRGKAGEIASANGAMGGPNYERSDKGDPVTAAAAALQGWGTALKPAWESVVLARKPLAAQHAVVTIGSCLSSLCASIAASTSQLSPSVSGAASGSARPTVEPKRVTRAALSDPMAMSPSASEIASILSIVSSWRDSLDALSVLMNTSTIGTDASLTTDLQTLSSLVARITAADMREAAMRRDGPLSLAAIADALFVGFAARCNFIRARSAIETATGLALADYLEGAASTASAPIVLARKPFRGTVAANAQAHGTGGLHIDACRIGTDDDLNGGAYSGDARDRPERVRSDAEPGASPLSRYRRGIGEYAPPLGRWPANVVLTHADGCRCVGTREIKRNMIDGTIKTAATEAAPEWGTMAGSRSLGSVPETVETWDCVGDCPVKILDEQAGDRPSGIAVTRNGGGGHIFGAEKGHGARPDSGYSDGGGPSRFFYTAKTSTAERERGLERRSGGELTGRKDGSAGAVHARGGTGGGSNGRANIHPTVKPVDLMRWLCRLVTPPGGIVLDPFAGSGSTIIAALAEGFRGVGLELDPEHVSIARDRIIGDAPLLNRTGTP